MKGIIPQIRVRNLKDREIESLLSLIIKLLEESELPSDIFAKIISELSRLLGQYQQAINRQRKNALTGELRKIDALRNQQLNSFMKGLTYYLTYKGTTVGDAAELVEKAVIKYGKGIHRSSDKVETVTIRSMIKDLSGTEETEALGNLHMLGLITSLNGSNEHFDKLYLERAASEVEDTTPHIIPTRKLIKEALNTVVYLLNLLQRTEPEAYATIAGELAQIIGAVMAVGKSRKTRNANETVQTEEPQEVDQTDETPVVEPEIEEVNVAA